MFESDIDEKWVENWCDFLETLVLELLERKASVAEVNFRTVDADTPVHTVALIASITGRFRLVRRRKFPLLVYSQQAMTKFTK